VQPMPLKQLLVEMPLQARARLSLLALIRKRKETVLLEPIFKAVLLLELMVKVCL
jgi:hypothetical protein